MPTFGMLLPILAAALAAPDVDAAFIRKLDPGPSGGTGGALMVEIFVAPDRTVEGCQVIVSSYNEAGNRRVCDQARKMQASTVAKDIDGNPVHGFVTLARIARTGSGPPRTPSDLEPAYVEVGVLDIPGRDTRKTVYVTVLVDDEGAVIHCQEPTQQDREFAQVACEQLGGERLPILRDRTGVAVRYVKALKVDFIEQPSGS